VRFRYSEFDGEAFQREIARRGLMQFFNQLLLRTNGDVDEALRWMTELRDRGHLPADFDPEVFRRMLLEEGWIQADEEGTTLTPKAEKQIRQESLALIFSTLARGAEGDHPTAHEGGEGEPMAETRPYLFGDPPSEIDYLASVKNAVGRTGELQLAEEDLEVFERHHQTSCATVLLLDISHSMVLYGEDRITPAKQVALALSELILTRFKRDSLDVVLFGDDAIPISVHDLAYVGAGPFHTNTRAGLRLAQDILAGRRHAQKQIFMVTDGKPSCIFDESGQLYKNPFGLDPRITIKTLDEAKACRRKRIVITTFMLAQDPDLVRFVEQLTQVNHGRAYYASPERLGGFVFVDYIRNRRRTVH
jgi:Ca-activated chloride channel homolog